MKGTYENKTVTINASVYGTNAAFHQRLVPQFYNTYQLYHPTLIMGRDISLDDIYLKRNVMVIDDLLALQLFGQDDAVGKEIHFPIYVSVSEADGTMTRVVAEIQTLEVIGVISHSPLSYRTLIQQLDSDEPVYYTSVFVPMTYDRLQDKRGLTQYQAISFVVHHKGSLDMQALSAYAQLQGEQSARLDYHTYESIQHSLAKLAQDSYSLIEGGSLVLLVVSAFSIFNTLLFSIKEKVAEIGIKKAMGATNQAILLEILIEGIFFGIIGSLIGIVISLFISSMTLLIVNHTLNQDYTIIYHFNTLIFTFLFPTLCTIIATIPVAIYASSIKVVDALRFE